MKLPPIYTECYHFTLDLLRCSANFPKQYRPTIGRRMEESALDMTFMLRKNLLASGGKNYSEVSIHVDSLKIYVQIATELKLFSPHQSLTFGDSLEKIGKMLGGLQKKSLPSPSKTVSDL